MGSLESCSWDRVSGSLAVGGWVAPALMRWLFADQSGLRRNRASEAARLVYNYSISSAPHPFPSQLDWEQGGGGREGVPTVPRCAGARLSPSTPEA